MAIQATEAQNAFLKSILLIKKYLSLDYVYACRTTQEQALGSPELCLYQHHVFLLACLVGYSLVLGSFQAETHKYHTAIKILFCKIFTFTFM